MSDIIQFRGQKVAPAFAHLSPDRSLGDGIQGGGFPVIHHRGKMWSLRYQGQTYEFKRDDDGSQLTYLDVIIIGSSPAVSKVYYPGEFDEDNAGRPVCSSVLGVTPDPGVPEPQSRTCALCPHNVWTTFGNGRRGKECQDHKRLAVLLMPAITTKMLGSPLLEPVYMKVPPGSLAPLKTYGDSLRHQGFPAAAVVTRVSFESGQLFRMKFEGKQVLSDKEAPLVLPLVDDPRTKRITGEEPDIYEADEPPPIKKFEEKVDTGLVEAFGTSEKPVTKPVTKAAPVEDEKVTVLPPAEAPKRGRGRPPKAAPVQVVEAAAEEEDSGGDEKELDDKVSDLLNQKILNMLK